MRPIALLVTDNSGLSASWAAALEPRMEVRVARTAVEAATGIGPTTALLVDLDALGESECEKLLGALVPGASAVVVSARPIDDAAVVRLLAAGAVDVVGGAPSAAALAARAFALERTQLPLKMRAHLVDAASLALCGHLARGFIHDLGNPLAFVHANLRTLREYRDEIVGALGVAAAAATTTTTTASSGSLSAVLDDMGPLLDETLTGAQRMDELLQNARAFLRPDVGTVASLDVSECVDSALRLLAQELRDFSVAQAVPPGCRVSGHEAPVRQLFVHLIYAALRVGARERPKRLAIGAEIDAANAKVLLRVEPIDRAAVAETWGSFFREGAMSGDGSSLSLAAARLIVREHSGTIGCAIDGEAMTVRLELPVQ